jgi:tetratricopeptide (TPR) repeat protein
VAQLEFKRNLAEAEEAFYQAARLSGPKADFFHAYSLWHLANMQDLQGRPAEAYDTVHKALRITPNDHDTMYDAARYAAKTGRESEALQLLDKCINLQPQTIITMFSEEDFVS